MGVWSPYFAEISRIKINMIHFFKVPLLYPDQFLDPFNVLEELDWRLLSFHFSVHVLWITLLQQFAN